MRNSITTPTTPAHRTARSTMVLPTLAMASVAVIASLTATAVAGPMMAQADHSVVVQKPTTPPTESNSPAPQVTGSLRDFVAPEHQADFDAYMADSNNRSTFFGTFQQGLDTATSSEHAVQGAAQDVLAYGFDRDHVWATLSYADVAHGAINIAVSYCKSRGVPSWICSAAGSWLNSLAQGYAPLANHGVWGAIYWNHYTGGRW